MSTPPTTPADDVPSAWEAKRGARTARGERTRQGLLDAALALLRDTDFGELRVADVAAAAGTSLGTFYKYFPTKEAMFHELVLELRDEILGRHDDRPAAGDGMSLLARIEAGNRRYLRAFRRYANIMVVLDYSPTEPEPIRDLGREFRNSFVGRIRQQIAQWQDDGLVAPEIDPRYAAHALGGMVSRFAFLWFVIGEPFNERRAVRQLSLLWANALGLTDRPAP